VILQEYNGACTCFPTGQQRGANDQRMINDPHAAMAASMQQQQIADSTSTLERDGRPIYRSTIRGITTTSSPALLS
jgi:hypothetical protein